MKMHKDIVDYIYKLIHQSNVIDIIKEYHSILKQDYVNDSCEMCTHCYRFLFKPHWEQRNRYFMFNFRDINITCSLTSTSIYNSHNITAVSKLPKNYYTYQ